MSVARRAVSELVFTVAVPVAVLTWGPERLGPTGAVLASLVPAAGFVVWRMAAERTVSATGALTLGALGLSGAVSLFELPAAWFALKEALLPCLYGLAIAATARTRFSPLRSMLELVLDPERLAQRRAGREAEYGNAMARATWEFAASIAGSGVWSGVLATMLVSSPAGTDAFATELGRYTAWSFPMVTLPTMMASGVVVRRALGLVEDALGVPWDTLLFDEEPPATG